MTIYVCSPFSAKKPETFMEYLQYTCEVSREIVLSGHEVIVPHLYYPNFLNDDIEEERNIGMKNAIKLLNLTDAIIVNKLFGLSSGMKLEIAHAKKNKMMILEANNMEELRELLKYTKV